MWSVTRGSLRDDLIAGLTNAVIVLPQGVAFALIAGLPPQYGLYAAMIPPVIAAIWGSSLVMVTGPTTAISAVLFATLSESAVPGTADYIALALAMTVMVGLFQLMAGLARLGSLISFISHSVMTGFTAAAAILIAASQLGDALGIPASGGGSVIDRLERIWGSAGDFSAVALLIAAVTLAAIILCRRVSRRLPAYLVALVVGSVVAYFIDAAGAGIEMFQPLPSILPSFESPSINASILAQLAPGAATVAFVGLLEAVSIGRSFAIRRGERYDANQEIVGQGLANFVGGFFQAYAGSGSFTRSTLNAEAGAKTPVSAMFASVFLLGLLFLIAPYVIYIPVPAIAGIIIYVGWRLINVREIRHLIVHSRGETIIFAITFVAGVLVELEFAIIAGTIASLALFLKQSAQPYIAVLSPAVHKERRSFRNAEMFGLDQCPKISIRRMEGPLFFGSVEHVESRFRQIDRHLLSRNIIVFVLKGVGRLDLAGADFLIHEIKLARRRGGDFHLVAMYPSLIMALRRMDVLDVLGEDHLHISKGQAIEAAVPLVNDDVCRHCRVRIFAECALKSGPADVSPHVEAKNIDAEKAVR